MHSGYTIFFVCYHFLFLVQFSLSFLVIDLVNNVQQFHDVVKGGFEIFFVKTVSKNTYNDSHVITVKLQINFLTWYDVISGIHDELSSLSGDLFSE